MKVIKREYEVYKYDELPEDARQKALEDNYDINVDCFDWWESVFEDAENIGIRIKSFDIDRFEITGELVLYPNEVKSKTLKEHGKSSNTYKTVKEYDLRKADFEEDEFLYSLLEDYRIMLQHEWEYLTSEEAIVETIDANNYDFTIDGKMFF